jgi:hypothetical protein
MFGYTIPKYNKMSSLDLGTYQRYYCETCHQLKDGFGLISTATVNYDMTFNTMILNSISGDVLDFEGTRRSPLCVFFDPKADSDLMRRMAAYTILLTKWELVDDDLDDPSIRTDLISLTLGKAINKAERLYPEYDETVGKGFEKLRSLEKEKCTDVIKMGNEFGRALSIALNDFAKDKANEHLEDLFVQLTTLIYILDAIDDLDEDFMKDTYNPYLVGCDRFLNKRAYISDNIYNLTDTINQVVKDMQSSYNDVKKDMRTCIGATDNIVYFGLPESAKNVLSGTSQAKASVKNVLKSHKDRNASY